MNFFDPLQTVDVKRFSCSLSRTELRYSNAQKVDWTGTLKSREQHQCHPDLQGDCRHKSTHLDLKEDRFNCGQWTVGPKKYLSKTKCVY